MRVPVYMKPKVKWREAGENGGDGKFRVGGSSPGCCWRETNVKMRRSRNGYKTMRREYGRGRITGWA
jgi:hypothetical protein